MPPQLGVEPVHLVGLADLRAVLEARGGAGVRDFLRSRRIELPEGEPDSSPEEESVWGRANR